MQVLEDIRDRKSTIEEGLIRLSRILNCDKKELRQTILVHRFSPNLEVHMTDHCNLKCYYCSFKRAKSTLTTEQAIAVVEAFSPSAITFSGGGENSLHPDFPSLVEDVANRFPSIKMGWVTNGIVKPKHQVTRYLSWLRISVDAATEETFSALKGRSGLEKCINNMMYLLNETEVPNIGLGFLFHKGNISEVSDFVCDVWRRIKSRDQTTRNRVNLQFRPLRPEYEEFTDIMSGEKRWSHAVHERDISTQLDTLNAMGKKDAELANFLENQTNMNILDNDMRRRWWMPNKEFSFCSVSLLYTLLRSDGSLFSCIHKGEYYEHRIGVVDNDLHNLEDVIIRATLLRYWFASLAARGCNSSECRYSHLNHISENALTNKPYLPASLQNNPFW